MGETEGENTLWELMAAENKWFKNPLSVLLFCFVLVVVGVEQ